MGVKVKYGDIAPGAKESFEINIDDKTSFVNIGQLNEYNLDVKNYANPCELYQTILDGSMEILPEYPEDVNMGLWSQSISDADGTFATPIEMVIVSTDTKYSSIGLTFMFDMYNNVFCNSLNIKWYQVDFDNNTETLLESADFTPNSALYFCQKTVEYYNKIVITFNSLNMPYNRLKIRSIDYGYGTFFYGDELLDTKVIQEINPISEAIPISPFDFRLNSKTNIAYSFQNKQPITVYFDDELIATEFVDTSTRLSRTQWSVKCEDYVGVLDRLEFWGDIYVQKNAGEILEDILELCKIPYTIDEQIYNMVVSGHIPICSARKAVQLICLAIGAVVFTANSDKLNVCILSNEPKQHIEKNRIKRSQSFEESNVVTKVSIESYSYKQTEEVVTAFDGNADSYSLEDDVVIKFSEPLHSISVEGGGSIVVDENGKEKKSANHVVISGAVFDTIVTGKKYKKLTRVLSIANPNTSSSDQDNEVEINEQTLVSPININDVLSRVGNYYFKRQKVTHSIYESWHRIKYGEAKYGAVKYGQKVFDAPINVGDVNTFDTEYLGTLEGRIISARYNLNGGILLKECEVI